MPALSRVRTAAFGVAVAALVAGGAIAVRPSAEAAESAAGKGPGSSYVQRRGGTAEAGAPACRAEAWAPERTSSYPWKIHVVGRAACTVPHQLASTLSIWVRYVDLTKRFPVAESTTKDVTDEITLFGLDGACVPGSTLEYQVQNTLYIDQDWYITYRSPWYWIPC